MHLIIDCNVLIAAGLKDGICRKVLKYAVLSCNVYLTEEILLEYLLVIRRDKFKQYKSTLEELAILLSDVAKIVKQQNVSFILPDNDDLKYLKAAASAKADFIITGNTKDFPDEQYGTIRIITPREFYEKFVNNIPNSKPTTF
jgi:putative PIN family toxin of toxin-antitoxin system